MVELTERVVEELVVLEWLGFPHRGRLYHSRHAKTAKDQSVLERPCVQVLLEFPNGRRQQVIKALTANFCCVWRRACGLPGSIDHGSAATVIQIVF